MPSKQQRMKEEALQFHFNIKLLAEILFSARFVLKNWQNYFMEDDVRAKLN